MGKKNKKRKKRSQQDPLTGVREDLLPIIKRDLEGYESRTVLAAVAEMAQEDYEAHFKAVEDSIRETSEVRAELAEAQMEIISVGADKERFKGQMKRYRSERDELKDKLDFEKDSFHWFDMFLGAAFLFVVMLLAWGHYIEGHWWMPWELVPPE